VEQKSADELPLKARRSERRGTLQRMKPSAFLLILFFCPIPSTIYAMPSAPNDAVAPPCYGAMPRSRARREPYSIAHRRGKRF